MEREEKGNLYALWMVLKDKTTAISIEQSLLHLSFTSFEGMTIKRQSSQPIPAQICPEQRGGHLGPGESIQGSVRGKKRKCEKPTALDLILVVSHILSSLKRANEGSKKQKSTAKAGNGSMGHSLN